MKFIFNLIYTFLRIGIANELQYRANFFLQLLQSLIALGVGLVGLRVVFNQTTELSGWTQPELLVVMGVFMLMGGLIQAGIQPNMLRLIDEIQRGTLDYAITKPADGQVIISVREFRFWRLTDALLGLGVLGYAMFQIQGRVGWQQGFGFLAALVLGGIMVYCFWLMLASSAFWIIRVGEIANLFEGIYAAGRWPVGIYPDWLRIGLTFLVPVAFAVTIPAEALTGRLNWQTLLFAAGLTLLLIILSRLVWQRGMRNYSGASA